MTPQERTTIGKRNFFDSSVMHQAVDRASGAVVFQHSSFATVMAWIQNMNTQEGGSNRFTYHREENR